MWSKTHHNALPDVIVRRQNRARRRRSIVMVCAAFGAGLVIMNALWPAPHFGAIVRADAASAWADTGPVAQAGGHKVALFEDLTIGSGEAWRNVVVVGGDVVIEGAVSGSVVVVGGDVTVRAGARVGYERWDTDNDAAVVSVFGNLIVEPGAELSGRIVDVAGGTSDVFTKAFVDPVTRPWKWTSIVGWIVSTIVFALAAVIMVAIAPRKIAAVADRVRRHLVSSLGWGLLLAVIGIPMITILLVVTVVGILVVIPWLAVVLPITLLFGFIAVAALLGGLIVGRRGDRRDQLMVAAVLGVVIFSVVRWIPFAGAVILTLSVLVGLGATVTAIWEGNRGRRQQIPGAGRQPPGPTEG